MLEQNVEEEISDSQKEASIRSQGQIVAEISQQGQKLMKGIVIGGHRIAKVSHSKVLYKISQIWKHFKRGFSSSCRPPHANFISFRS